jgi:hypothetical protein
MSCEHKIHTGRTLGDNRGRDWSNTAARQVMPKTDSHHNNLEKARIDSTQILEEA